MSRMYYSYLPQTSSVSVSEDEQTSPDISKKKAAGQRFLTVFLRSACVMMFILILVFGFFIFMQTRMKNGYSSRDVLISSVFDAIDNRDSDKFRACFPDDSFLASESRAAIRSLTTTMTSEKQLYTFDTENMTEKSITELSPQDIKQQFGLRASDGYEIVITIPFIQEKDNMRYYATEDFVCTAVYYQRKWVLVDLNVDSSTIAVSNYEMIADKKENTDTLEDLIDEVSDSPISSGNILINDTIYTVPFLYQDIALDYAFDITDYGMDGVSYQKDYMLNSMDKIDGICLKSTRFPNSFLNFSIQLFNPTGQAVSVYDGYIRGFLCEPDKKYTKDPDLIVSGGGTWSMTEAEIQELYGEPAKDEIYTNSAGDYTSYTYREVDDTGRNWVLIFEFLDNQVTGIQYYYK